MSFVKAGMKVPARHLVAGIPARPVRALSEDDLAVKIEGTGAYHALVRRCRETMVAVEPLTEIDANRKRTDAALSLPARDRQTG